MSAIPVLEMTVAEEADRDQVEVGRLLDRRDDAAFRQLYGRHTPAMFACARRLLGPRLTEVEDLIQEAWLRAVRQLPGFQWQSSLRTWLVAIVVNCCRERWRSRDFAPAAFGPEPTVSSDPTLLIDLDRAIALLPLGYRTVLVLHDVEGYTHQEIGERLGLDAGTSKSQLSRARRALRRILSNDRRSP